MSRLAVCQVRLTRLLVCLTSLVFAPPGAADTGDVQLHQEADAELLIRK